jgi:hypothetical protein
MAVVLEHELQQLHRFRGLISKVSCQRSHSSLKLADLNVRTEVSLEGVEELASLPWRVQTL